MPKGNYSDLLIEAARELSTKVERLKFGAPVAHVYNPLTYAWKAHEEYLCRFGNTPKRVVFLGMNPGPFGMVQTGIPFGEIPAVRDWMGIKAQINQPKKQHPNRPILGFNCKRSEISGKRFWGLFAERFKTPEAFFQEHFVVNYCPLAFLQESGSNRTPNQLPKAESESLFEACDEHLQRVLEILKPEYLVGVGDFAAKRATVVAESLIIGQILHPSPANPMANKDWPGKVIPQLVKLKIWE